MEHLLTFCILYVCHLNEQEVLLSINYMGIAYKIRNVDQIKICGLYFCNDPVVEYDHNILSKVERFELQLKKWMCRNLTIEGNIFLVGAQIFLLYLICYGHTLLQGHYKNKDHIF